MKKIIMICLMAVIGFGVSDAMAQKKQVELKTTVFQTDVDCENCAKKVDNSIPYQKGVTTRSYFPASRQVLYLRISP